MAAHPVVVVDDELIEKLPEAFRHDPRYQKGASLKLVPVESREGTAPDTVQGDWRNLRGALAHLDKSLNDELDAERQREKELDARVNHG